KAWQAIVRSHAIADVKIALATRQDLATRHVLRTVWGESSLLTLWNAGMFDIAIVQGMTGAGFTVGEVLNGLEKRNSLVAVTAPQHLELAEVIRLFASAGVPDSQVVAAMRADGLTDKQIRIALIGAGKTAAQADALLI